MGRHCVTFNCTESLHTSLVNRLLSGMIQAGSWLIWDNAERIPHSMMSVLGQQLDYLKQTYRVLEASMDSQYVSRGTSRHDKVSQLKVACYVPEENMKTYFRTQIWTPKCEFLPKCYISSESCFYELYHSFIKIYMRWTLFEILFKKCENSYNLVRLT